jgi:5-methylcytosine-specific restriction endonuclease McrA
MRIRCINYRTCGNWAKGKGKCAACLRAKDHAYKHPVYRANRAAVLAAANGVCQCRGCGVCSGDCKRVANTADHVIPLSKGGGHDSLRAVCRPCNSSRGKTGG